MSDVAFVFSNPRHHLEMMAPVAEELTRRSVSCSLVSLAELRGFDTPAQSGARRVIPINLRRRDPSAKPALASQAPGPSSGEPGWRRGALAKRLVWSLVGARLRWMLRRARVVVVPNDAVYPYSELLDQLHRRRVRTVLMQEGIRFPQPGQPEGYTGPRYGTAVSSAVCAWGEGSKDFFVQSRVPEDRIVVTGTPRLDDLDLEAWRERGRELIATLGLPSAPIAFLSNPIEHQGYGSHAGKLELFAKFLAGAAPVLAASGIPVIVKNHMHEDPQDYARVAAASPLAGQVTVLDSGPTFAAIACARAVVVLTSTVGLEALTFDQPLGVLEIPGHEFAFEYVQRGAAVPIRIADVTRSVEQLLAPDPVRAEAGQALVRRHLHDRGRARHNVADVIERVLSAAPDMAHGPRKASSDTRGEASNETRSVATGEAKSGASNPTNNGEKSRQRWS